MSKKPELPVGRANCGDKEALTSVVLGIKVMIYNLALKMPDVGW